MINIKTAMLWQDGIEHYRTMYQRNQTLGVRDIIVSSPQDLESQIVAHCDLIEFPDVQIVREHGQWQQRYFQDRRSFLENNLKIKKIDEHKWSNLFFDRLLSLRENAIILLGDEERRIFSSCQSLDSLYTTFDSLTWRKKCSEVGLCLDFDEEMKIIRFIHRNLEFL